MHETDRASKAAEAGYKAVPMPVSDPWSIIKIVRGFLVVDIC